MPKTAERTWTDEEFEAEYGPRFDRLTERMDKMEASLREMLDSTKEIEAKVKSEGRSPLARRCPNPTVRLRARLPRWARSLSRLVSAARPAPLSIGGSRCARLWLYPLLGGSSPSEAGA
jgi:hypothetical protein